MTALLARLRALLVDFPRNAVLERCVRAGASVLSADARAPLRAVLGGLHVLLARCQDWQEHASKAVSIEPQLAALRKLVATWRAVELSAWPDAVDAAERGAALNRVARTRVATARRGSPPAAAAARARGRRGAGGRAARAPSPSPSNRGRFG